MARKSFVNIVRDLKAEPGKRTQVPVPGEAGLYVRATDRGSRTFTIVARRRVGKKQVWRTVPYPVDMDSLTSEDLDEVKLLAREGITRIMRGEDPFPPAPAEPDSLQKVARNWLDRQIRKKGEKRITTPKIERTLERLVYPVLGKRPLEEIRRTEIVGLMDKIEDENGIVMADRTLEILRSLLAWHETRHDDFVSPIRRGMARTKPSMRRRKRVLCTTSKWKIGDLELRLLWGICDKSGPTGAMVQLLLLTGQRLEKVQQMRWQDVGEDGVWNIPSKGDREKANAGTLPLPAMALEIIRRQPTIVGNPYVFASARTDGFFNGLSKGKKALDEKLLAALKAEDPGAELEPWVLHSLRHTAKTLMSRCRVSDFDSERVLGHAIPGIGGIYNHDEFVPQMGTALEKLAAEIDRIVDPPPADEKVVDIHKAVAE